VDILVQYDAPHISVKFPFDQTLNTAFKTEFQYAYRWDPARRAWLIKASVRAAEEVRRWVASLNRHDPPLRLQEEETEAFRRLVAEEFRKSPPMKRKEIRRDSKRAEGLARYIARSSAQKGRRKYGDIFDRD
jgi:hypothetical protein